MAKQALEGIKVADFTWAVVGPWATKILANAGATVVKIESMTKVCVTRTFAIKTRHLYCFTSATRVYCYKSVNALMEADE